jgi:hypothetical protein
MVFISEKRANKRVKLYNTRPTKVGNGWSKHYGANNVPDRFLKVLVHGTFDSLAKVMRFDMVKVRLRHPTDYGYTKTVYILKKNKHKYQNRII